ATGVILNSNVSFSGGTAKWTDIDGDAVTLQVSKGSLSPSNIGFASNTPNALGGYSLNTLNLNSAAYFHANVAVTASKTGVPAALGSDGLVNVGNIVANNLPSGTNPLNVQGIDLGAVKVGGDLGAI